MDHQLPQSDMVSTNSPLRVENHTLQVKLQEPMNQLMDLNINQFKSQLALLPKQLQRENSHQRCNTERLLDHKELPLMVLHGKISSPLE
jgi:hypothetical protein